MVETITAAQLQDRIEAEESFYILDTRPEESYDSWHIEDAIQYTYKPDHDFDAEEFRKSTGLDTDDEIVTVCAKGVSSFDLTKHLEDAGYENVTVVEDGMEGWSQVYDTVEIHADAVDIVQFQRRAKGCLSYLIGDPETEKAAVIDPTRNIEMYPEAASERGYTVEYVLDTHVHADHLSGGRELADNAGATYCLGAGAGDRRVSYEYRSLGRNEVVSVGDVEIKTLSTPGHTSESVSYLVDGEAVLTGDALFVNSVGRTELQFGASDAATGAELLYNSLHRTLLSQPEDVSVLPGHFAVNPDGTADVARGEPVYTTVREARKGLELLNLDKDEFVHSLTESVPEKPANYETIIDVNTGKHIPEEEGTATELELGPNNCAATEG